LEKNVIPDARTIAATPSLRRCAEIGHPLFAAIGAILAIMLYPRECVGPEHNPVDTVTPEQAGLTI
jgi:hypothetical protein